MDGFKKLSYEELVEVCKKRKDDYEYIPFKQLFDLKQGDFNYNELTVNSNSDIRLITYNNKNDIKINSDSYNIDALYISNILLGHNKIIAYSEGKSIHSRNSCHIKPKGNFEKVINMRFIFHYLDFHQEFIINSYYTTGNVVKSLNKTKIGDMIIVLPPLQKQIEIIEYLDKIQEDFNRKVNETTKEHLEHKSLFISANV